MQAANALLAGHELEEPVPQRTNTVRVPDSVGPRKKRKKPKGQKLDGFFGAPALEHDLEHQAMTVLPRNKKSLADVVRNGGSHLEPSMGAMTSQNEYHS